MSKDCSILLFVSLLRSAIAFQSIQALVGRKCNHRQILFSDYLSSLAPLGDNGNDFPEGIDSSTEFFPAEFSNDGNTQTVTSSADWPTEVSSGDTSAEPVVSTSNPTTITSHTEWPTEYSTVEAAATLEEQQQPSNPSITQPPNQMQEESLVPPDMSASAVGTSGPSYTETSSDKDDIVSFLHAPISYFNIDKLSPKGPRKNADVGQPHDASRKLDETGGVSSGSWWCAKGGWPSPTERATTEVFFVLEGNGCVTDVDGQRHYFGSGDTVILPKGWSGRWDVLEDIHKIWFIHDHPKIEGRQTPIRAIITHYSMFTPQYLSPPRVRADAMYGTSPSTAFRTFYDIGPTKVGCWTCTPGSFPVTSSAATTEVFHVLEGVFFLTGSDGNARRCVAGDTVMLPPGWTGGYDIIEPTKKLWVAVE